MIVVIKLLIYYGMILLFPLVWRAFYTFFKTSGFLKKTASLLLGLICLLGVWARFVEPYVIVTHYTSIQAGFSARVALISDIHLGLFQGRNFLENIVEKLNDLDVDMVWIAGDFTADPPEDELVSLFAPLADLRHTTYAVLGNHDVEKPGPPIRDALVKVLEENEIVVLNNDIVQFEDFSLVGLGSHWNNEDDVALLDTFSTDDAVVVMAHNPDTTLLYTNNVADVTVAGHTHAGQIRIPGLYPYVIPTVGNFDKGLTQETHTQLFISAGLGMTGLPMRFLNPPVIDVLVFE